MKTVKYLFVLAGLTSISVALASQPGKKLGDGNDGNRSGPVHIINLKDENGLTIDPEDELPKPISMKNTCGECHNYDKISSGWHFHSGHVKPGEDSKLIYLDKEVPGGFKDIESGRRGEPWVLIDPATRSQIPVSSRGWNGSYTPHELKLRPWDMVKLTSSHSPGGNYGEMKPSDDTLDLLDDNAIEYGMDEPVKWMNSGKLEVNCLACHGADSRQDMGGPGGTAMQIARENLRWAATAGSGIGTVSGAVLGVDFFDIETDDTVKTVYDQSRFDDKKKVFIDIVKSPPANRCYFCHSTQKIVIEPKEVEVTEFVKTTEDQPAEETAAGSEVAVEETETEKAPEKVTRIDTINVDVTQETGWIHDEDIHLKSGMTCSDCHRNGADHMISRGDKEFADGGMGQVSTLSCRGCHLGDETADSKAAQKGGRMSAPKPLHAGIPTIHFKELACTACHSGPYPEKEAGLVKTARIHKIGLHGPHNPNWKNPHVSSPVFIRNEDNHKIAPHKLFWPSFWATAVDMKNADGTVESVVTPMKPSLVAELAGDVLETDKIPAADMMLGDWRPLAEAQILETLQVLDYEIEEPQEEGALKPQAVYIAGGKMYKVVETKAATDDADAVYGLVSEENKAAAPYAWPIAHDVRPASQSLGTEGHCNDCHGFRNDAAFFYSKVTVDSPVVADAVMAIEEPAELKKSLKDLAANAPVKEMVSFQEISPLYIWSFNTSFVFRPMMKITVMLCCGLIGAVLALYGLKAICCIAKAVSRDDK